MQIYDSYMTDRLLAPPNPTSVGAHSNRSDRAEEQVSSALACPDNLGGKSWFVNLVANAQPPSESATRRPVFRNALWSVPVTGWLIGPAATRQRSCRRE